jgi:putative phosphoribosyl transferase
MTNRESPPRKFVYANRAAAGFVLAEAIHRAVSGDGAVVLGLPRGGVPVAAPVAATLQVPLDVLVVRKIGLPSQPELAMGAIAGVEDDVEVVRNERVLDGLSVPDEVFEEVLRRELVALHEREASYREGAPAVAVEGRTVVVVDDGLATGSTMRAAVAALSRRRPAMIVVAVPVGAPPTCTSLAEQVDLLICPEQPPRFEAVGRAYGDFGATSDEEVRAILAEH